MKPVIIIELDDGTRQIYITKIELVLVGATTFVAVHLFIHAAIAFYTQITKQLTKKTSSFFKITTRWFKVSNF